MSESSTSIYFSTVRIGGFVTARATRSELAESMVADGLEARKQGHGWLPRLVFSSNGQGIALAGRDASFLRAMDTADLIHADGMPVVLASKATPSKLPERIATTDFFHDAARAASEAGLRFFFLGATEEQNRAAVERVKALYPELVIAGRHHGHFTDSENEDVIGLIRESAPDVVWVALGKPRQELWCIEAREKLTGVGWLKTCGGLYAFLAGDASRAPRWMRAAGLEWLYRAASEPRRLLWRYLSTNPYAMWRILRHTDWRADEMDA